jgi:hypothetical protein
MWVFIGDIGIAISILATVCVYLGQRNASNMRQLDSTLAALHAAGNGVGLWGPQHFSTAYTNEVATQRARKDYVAIIGHGYSLNFRVPIEPIVSLIEHAGDKWQIDRKTIEAANKALWRIVTFNQIVEMQTNFNALHFSEILSDTIDDKRRAALAKSAEVISYVLHANTIGDESWYQQLMDAIDANIRRLESEHKRHWWSSPA